MLKKELPPNVPYDAARQTVPHIQARCALLGASWLRNAWTSGVFYVPPKKLSFFRHKNVVRKLDVY